MKMFGRIALVIAILACAGALFFANKLGGQKKDMQGQIAGLTDDKNRLTTDLANTTTTLNNTKQVLAKKEDELVAKDGELQGTKASLAAKTQEANTLKQNLDDRSRDLEQTKTELAGLKEEMQKIQDVVATDDFKNINQIRERLTAQAEEGKILGQQLILMRDKAAMLEAKVEELSITPVNLRGKVAAVRDNWGFVVLDLGRAQRVQTNTSFLVYRDTKMIGKVQVRTVGATTSVAEVLPEFQRAAPRVGDLVVH